ncbi:MAG: ParA family protein [Gammaproteobacteria bacterium]|jgi:chromosome partitioning protein|nr:ParA family protein [Gammaproteobacteria bacterium]MBU0786135.1 ParA family protein [Gammaproteobacteria bacterium]MBU0816715.1 ParA family protein [Gammaproteobacteria bacterium]MBU1786879.1 ParA family protein [Gammaproteobacteria bacterium]
MPVIAVVNRKGGSGKSTVAAHLAAWCARNGSAVMLGDVDRQQSTRAWLRRRDASLPTIAPWVVDQKNILRVPTGITHVVLDTPGGMHGFDLARMVMFSDAILMPVCSSAFDREAAAACHAELMTLPRVASGRCKLAAIGMRIDARTHAAQILKDWADDLKLPFLGVLRETQLYVQCLERGMTIFDLPPQRTETDMAQWEPIKNWLTPMLYPVQAANDPSPSRPLSSSRLGAPRPDSLMPPQESLVHGGRLAGSRAQQHVTVPPRTIDTAVSAFHGNASDRQQIPPFLRQRVT